MVFFGIAAVWGFLIGSGAILGGLSLLGRPVGPEPLLLGLLAVALVLAVVGGWVAAAAYRETTQR